MVLPIPDADGNTYYRTVGKSLVNHKAVGNDRILIPTRDNYESVLNIRALPLALQLVVHMIYDNVPEQEAICQLLQVNENFQKDTYKIAENLYSRTESILALTNPSRYCSRVALDGERIWGNGERNTAGEVYRRMPTFLQNLIDKAVAPDTMQIENEELLIRNCYTCQIKSEGLVADVHLYNPVEPKYRAGLNENVLQVENVLKFKGNSNAMQKSLNRYEHYPITVPLMLGTQIVVTAKTVPRSRAYTITDLSNPATPIQ